MSAMLHQISNDFINWNSFNWKLSFSQTIFLRSFNSVLDVLPLKVHPFIYIARKKTFYQKALIAYIMELYYQPYF